MNTLFAKQSLQQLMRKALHFEFKAIVWKDNEKHTAKSQRDLCSCSWGTLENSSKNLRPEFQRRRTKEKNEIQHFFHLATIPSWNAITVSGVSLIFGLKKRWEILGQAATILRKFITVCLEGVEQSWSESKVEENQSQIGERVSWRQATTRRAAGLHHIFQPSGLVCLRG